MSEHCKDQTKDRAVGRVWEFKFLDLARAHGWMVQALQAEQTRCSTVRDGIHMVRIIGPDMRIWKPECGMFDAEVKHKNPTRGGKYGLEEYRFRGLVRLRASLPAGCDIIYVIHDWTAVGRDSGESRIEDWRYARVEELAKEVDVAAPVATYFGTGGKVRATCFYWYTTRFAPLRNLFEDVPKGEEQLRLPGF